MIGLSATVHIGRQRAAECQAVGAGLLLNDAPGRGASLLHGDQALHELRPLDAGIGLDDPALGIECDDPVHGPHVDEDRPGGELLAAHGMSAAGDAHRPAFGARCRERTAECLLGIDCNDAVDAGGVELGMGVIDQGTGGGRIVRNQGRRRNRFHPCADDRGVDRHVLARLYAGPHHFGEWSLETASRFNF